MALTDFCSIFASVHENAINTVIKAVATQRPSLFNYGTPFFVRLRDARDLADANFRQRAIQPRHL
jgi:hypothetical protein